MTRHNEKPSKRINPSGKIVWVARYTNRDGVRVLTKPQGSFELRGPCRKEQVGGMCCAQHAINAAYDRQESGPSRGGVTVREYAQEWTRLRPRSERTNITNESRLAMVIGPFTPRQLERERRERLRKGHKPRTGVLIEGLPLGDWLLEDLRPRHGKDLLAVLLVDQGRSAAGAKNVLLTLSALFADAMDDDKAIVNPWGVKVRAGDPRIRKEPRKPRVLSWEQMHALAAASDHEAMIRVAADCGLRLGELLGLAAEDVKLGGSCDEQGCGLGFPHLHVRRTAHDGKVRMGTKRERLRGRSEGGRVVPVPAATASLLRGLPTRMGATPMFFSPAGRTWRQDTFRSDVWERARRASGVEASPQDFRHSWVSLHRAAGVDAADLAAMAGHSVQVADATYTHALGRSYEAVMRQVGA